MPLTICAQLWPVDGQEGRLAAYEDEVLELVPEYGGAVLSRVRRVEAHGAQPYEVQIIELPDQTAMDGYLADPRRTALASMRDEVIERTEIIPVTQIPTD